MRALSFPSAYRTGQAPYDIFKDRMNAISSIVGGIKDIIANKFINKQNAMIAENVLNEINKQQAIDLSAQILSDPPDEIYPADLEDTVGQFYDKFAMFGELAQKEKRMGMPMGEMGQITKEELGLPAVGGIAPTGGLPAVGGVTPTTAPTPAPTTEAMIPKTDMYQLYNVIKDLPTGEITWDNIYKKMTEKKPFWMGTTGPEQYVLNQMLEQVKDPRAKIESDINLAKLVKESFAPEEEKRPGKYPYTEEEVKEYELYKKSLEPPEEQIDFDKLNEFIETHDMKLSGVNVNPKTGNLSYSFSAKTTEKSWGEFLEEANEFIKLNPDYEVTSTNPKTGSVTVSKKGEPPVTTIKPPTYTTAEKIEEGFMTKVETIQDFTSELNRLKSLKIDVSMYETTEYFARLMKEKYNEAIGVIQYCMRGIQSGEETDEDGLNYRDTYKEWWEKSRNYDEQCFMVTGERLLAPPGGVTP
ncbi:hypothetical protein ES708_19434 [subsurface metagenome]